MEQFYIDRQFGLAIWIDVEKGIVQRCYNETDEYNAKMNEKYVGKSITFLKEDFIDRAMKGTYHHLRAESITSHLQFVEAFKSRIRNINGKLAMYARTTSSTLDPTDVDKEIAGLKDLREQYTIKQSKAEKGLSTEKERILTEHNFVS